MPRKCSYQWEKFIDQSTPENDLTNWQSPVGPIVISRDKSGRANTVARWKLDSVTRHQIASRLLLFLKGCGRQQTLV